jgi:hypothetical protein
MLLHITIKGNNLEVKIKFQKRKVKKSKKKVPLVCWEHSLHALSILSRDPLDMAVFRILASKQAVP